MGDKDVVKEGDVEVEETQAEGLPVTLCVLLGEPVEDVELQGEELTRELPDRVTLEQAVGDTEVWLAVGVDVSPEMRF